MSMPEESSSLSNNGEVVQITLSSLNWTLSYVQWPIRPSAAKLSDSMPVNNLLQLTCHPPLLLKKSFKLILVNHIYQCMLMLFGTWLTTLTNNLSPSLAMTGGPGNLPFTVTMLFVWHSLVTFCNLICTLINKLRFLLASDRYNLPFTL